MLFLCAERERVIAKFFFLKLCNFFLPVSSLLCIRSARCCLGNICERFCASRPLLGSYVHQESI